MFSYQILDLCKLQINQWRKPDKIKKIQDAKLKNILLHAARFVPYYKNLFNSQKISPSDIQNINDLNALPLMSKENMQALSIQEKTAENVDLSRCLSFTTSGTTGLPLKFWMTRRDFTMRNLNSARTYLACGFRPWQKLAVLSGDRAENQKKNWYEHLGIWRRKEISSWKSPGVWLEELKIWNPHLLIGRVTTLKLLVEELMNQNTDCLHPGLVLSGAGILDEASRRFIAAAFNAPVVDFYSTFEGGFLA